MAAPEVKGMRVGELARRSGVDKQLIHYYLRKGYLHPPSLSPATRRSTTTLTWRGWGSSSADV